MVVNLVVVRRILAAIRKDDTRFLEMRAIVRGERRFVLLVYVIVPVNNSKIII